MKSALWLVATGLVLVVSASSFGAWTPGDGARIVRVDADNERGAGFFQYVFVPGPPIDGVWQWRLAPGMGKIRGPQGELIGEIENLELVINTDPFVTLNFSAVAGPFGTNFTITSAVIPFVPIANPDAYATAAITVTDNNLNGATLTGLLPGTKAYRAYYNAPAVDWAVLVDPVVAPAGASAVGGERRPALPQLWETIAGNVDQIGSQFRFHLTALDSASGTSRFEVVPEPVSLALLALGGLLVRRRVL